MAAAAKPQIFSIDPGIPFLEALAAGILRRYGRNPDALARVTILLPTRRACRNLSDAFLRAADGAPLLLPVIRPLGDADEDELDLRGALDASQQPMPTLERDLLLARLLMLTPLAGGDPANALHLARPLAALLDTTQTEEVGLDKLPDLVQGELADHWQQTVQFLAIIREQWPAIKAERGQLDSAEHRRLRMQAWIDLWRAAPPHDPVIAAGSTGTIPATARLLHLVARLPQGCVVLPGLDQHLDDASWAELREEPTHPQYALAQLLEKLEVARAEVQPWSDMAQEETPRLSLLREALLPPEQTHRWRDLPPPPAAAFDGLQRIEAPGPREEAMAIALAMRETLEIPGRTAALITPDRGLARRVAAELRRFDIAVDDSAGRPLGQTPPAILLRQLNAALAEDFAPVPLLSLLKHPFLRLNLPRGEWLRWVRLLEREALRGTLKGKGLDGLAGKIGENTRLTGIFEDFRAALLPLLDAFSQAQSSIPQMLRALIGCAERLCATTSGRDMPLWQQEDGEALHGLMVDLLGSGESFGPIAPAQWPRLFEALLAGAVVRPRWGSHPRLSILGLLEARLVRADRVILAGLNEGTWPPQPEEDPWLSRPMRKQLGLPAPERRLGQTAHDFVMAAAHADCILSRSAKVDGTPTVPARWLARLEARLGENDAWKATLQNPYLHWADMLDRPAMYKQTDSRPRPRPPVAARPRALSVTRIEEWIRDPYALYARRILALKPLDELARPADARVRGEAIHDTLEKFLRQHPDALPDDDAALAELLALGQETFAPYMQQPAVAALWWPRFERAMRWFLDYERERRMHGFRPVLLEQKGELEFAAPAGSFTLSATADRIDRSAFGMLSILDYKTGTPPTAKQVKAGLAPQLALEAAIAKAGGFADLPAAAIAELVYIRLRGGEVPGEASSIEGKNIPGADELADIALNGLKNWVSRFDDASMPYLSRPRPQFVAYAGDYDHLARTAERSEGDE